MDSILNVVSEEEFTVEDKYELNIGPFVIYSG